MPTCPNCGEDNPERAKFCMNCTTPLREAVAPAEERKVVTILFCDLVGFTERSDRADPEDVKAILRPFHARIKREIEAFGGALDKFIGDAALGVFGSPVTHEDDPERAVRCALSMVDAVAELNAEEPALDLAVRIAVNTGQAVVSYGRGALIGEAVTGDVVNTASRLQSVAPVGGVIVAEPTYRETKDVFVYEELPAVTVKGKSEPLAVWRVVEAKGRVGADLTRRHRGPFVGRHAERGLLLAAYERAAYDNVVQLVTVVGEPGVGKSRLVAELGRHADRISGLVTWRRGRCLPYGEGVTFWALGEIVKGHAGILESDPPDVAAGKLDAVIPEDEPDRPWLRQRLAPLAGAETAGPTEREESFTAWRRFLERLASSGPAVFVFEDIHWADPAMLAFLEHVAVASRDLPMLLLCTARPDLFERHPEFADDAGRIDLSPLSAEETNELVSSLLDRAELPGDVGALLLERSGGNPLYAEEFVRMLWDRGLLVSHDGGLELAEGAEISFPDSIQALIAARLDAVPPDRKTVLQDAAVVGRVFWPGALLAMVERDERSVAESLEELSRKELVRPVPVSSMQGEEEYAFWHMLIRDVAYGQIPRQIRAARHRSAAAWIERIAADRVEDHAEVLAHHYVNAFELATATRQSRQADEARSGAARFLVLAGDHALGLDVASAERHYSRALDLLPENDPGRAEVLARWADAVRQAGRGAEAAPALEEAIAMFRDRGDRLAAARWMGTLSAVLLVTASPRQEPVAEEAVELLESEPPGPDLVAAYARMAGVKVVLGKLREAIEWADRATALASGLEVEIPARVLGFRGYARCAMGDPAGLEDMRTAIALAVERGEGRDAAVMYNNLAVAQWPIEGPASVLATYREGIDFSERRGITEFALAMSCSTLEQLVNLGEWDRVVEEGSVLIEQAAATDNVADLLQVRWALALVLGGRGRTDEARPLVDWLVPAARAYGGAEDVTTAFTVAARVFHQLGERDRAVELIDEVARWPHVRESPTYAVYLCEMLRIATAEGELGLAERLATGFATPFPAWEHARCAADAILLEARAEIADAAERYAEAAERWGRFGVVPERAHALLGQGRCLLALGSPSARRILREAREVFDHLEARPAVEETDSLLARAKASMF